MTQQPGSIPAEILSQGDNWFVFHLLAEGDLRALQKANAHFSDDLLSSLLNEPLPGHGVFWSSVSDTPYPIPVRALLFEESFEPSDPLYARPAADCYASRLRSRLRSALDEAVAVAGGQRVTASPSVDAAETFARAAIRGLDWVHGAARRPGSQDMSVSLHEHRLGRLRRTASAPIPPPATGRPRCARSSLTSPRARP